MDQLQREATVAVSPALPDFSRWGPIERSPMRSLRRTVARRMSQAWQTVPHVTQQDQADISEFEAVRRTLKRTSPALPLTLTAFAVAVVAAALKEFPPFNASLDVARNEIVYKRYINIGVAVDTERGLIVPVIKNADQKSMGTLSTEIAAMAATVRTSGATREDLEGGTFTITNLGGLGGTAFTPIVNYPEVAILGLSRSAPTPVFINDRFEARPMLPLSLSYGHRLIDGADAVRVPAVGGRPARTPAPAGAVRRMSTPGLLGLGSSRAGDGTPSRASRDRRPGYASDGARSATTSRWSLLNVIREESRNTSRTRRWNVSSAVCSLSGV